MGAAVAGVAAGGVGVGGAAVVGAATGSIASVGVGDTESSQAIAIKRSTARSGATNLRGLTRPRYLSIAPPLHEFVRLWRSHHDNGLLVGHSGINMADRHINRSCVGV